MINAYIKILEFASDFQGLTFERLFNYVQSNDLRFYNDHKVTYYDTQLNTIFNQDFVDENGNPVKREYRGKYIYHRPPDSIC